MKIYACLVLVMVSGMLASEGEKKRNKKREFVERPVSNGRGTHTGQGATCNTVIKKELAEMGMLIPTAATSSATTTNSSEVPTINIASINHPATPTFMPALPETSNNVTTRVVNVESSSSDVVPIDKEFIRIKIKNMCMHAIKVRIIGNGMQQLSVGTGDKNRHHHVDVPWQHQTGWQKIKKNESALLELPTFARIIGPENISWVRYTYRDGNLLIRSLNNKNMRSKINSLKKQITITAIDSGIYSHIVKCNTMKDTEGKLSFQVVSDTPL